LLTSMRDGRDGDCDGDRDCDGDGDCEPPAGD
jgi:hypothetical protein